MAFEKRSVVVIMVVMGFYCLCEATVYKVGDSAGWTDNGKVAYKAWSSSKIFRVGDTILFEYDNRFSNVVRVSHHDFNACSNLHAYFSVNSGNDSFVIPRPDHYYFISGVAGHCKSGQRVDIRVHRYPTPSVPAPTSAPISPSTPAPAPTPVVHAPAPAPANAPTPTSAAYTPTLTPASSSPSGSASPSGEPAPGASEKHSGAVTIYGLAMAMAVAVAFSGFGYW